MKKLLILSLSFFLVHSDEPDSGGEMSRDIFWLRVAYSFYLEGEVSHAATLLQSLGQQAEFDETKKLAIISCDELSRGVQESDENSE